jgi:PAS domain S-box-containing protein
LLAEAHLSAIVQSSDDAIISKSLDGIVQTWNPAATRIFGFTEAEMIGQSIRKLIPPDRQREEDGIIARIARGERVKTFETMRQRKDGTQFWASLTVSPILAPDGTVMGASKIVRDVSERHEAQAVLAEREHRLRILADNISQLTWVTDPQGNLLWFNKRWYDFTGLTEEECLHRRRLPVHHPDHVDRVVTKFYADVAAGVEWEDTYPMRGKDGNYRWFLSRAKPIRDETGAIVNWFGSNTDVTEMLEKEEQIRLLLMEVNHRSKNMLAVVQALARRSGGAIRNSCAASKTGCRAFRPTRTCWCGAGGSTFRWRNWSTRNWRFSIARAVRWSRSAGQTCCSRRARRKSSAWRFTNWPPTRSNMARCRSPVARSGCGGKPRTTISRWLGANAAARAWRRRKAPALAPR